MIKTFEYNDNEFYKGIRSILFKTNKIKIFDMVLFPVLMIISFFMQGIIANLLRIVSTVGIVTIIYQYWIMPKNTYSKNIGYSLPYTVFFSEEGIEVTNNDIKSFTPWDKYEKVYSDTSNIYFCENNTNFLIAPKRIFNNDEIQWIIEIAKNRMEKVKK